MNKQQAGEYGNMKHTRVGERGGKGGWRKIVKARRSQTRPAAAAGNRYSEKSMNSKASPPPPPPPRDTPTRQHLCLASWKLAQRREQECTTNTGRSASVFDRTRQAKQGQVKVHPRTPTPIFCLSLLATAWRSLTSAWCSKADDTRVTHRRRISGSSPRGVGAAKRCSTCWGHAHSYSLWHSSPLLHLGTSRVAPRPSKRHHRCSHCSLHHHHRARMMLIPAGG